MEKIMTHFGHDHPLTFFEEEGDDYKPNSICSMCTFPILSIPSYACTLPTCSGFFLHQPCALLPKTFQNPLHPKEQCILINPRYPKQCRKCRKPIQNFAYRSLYCRYIHPMCAKPVEIKIKHKSHPQHPLVAIHKEMSTECDACGEEHKGVFFSCGIGCSFWIHKDCASSPSVVKLVSHKHPLILTYALYDLYDTRYRFPDCRSCGKVIFEQGLYFCARCGHKYHMKCVSTSDVQILDSESQKEYWIHLPSERHRFPNWIKNFSEYMIREDIMYSKLVVIEKCHNNHDLTFHENYPVSSSKCIVAARDGDEDEDHELVCDGCTQPIFKTSPIWGCFEPGCDFLLHHLCATNLPSDSEYYSRRELLIREPGNSKYFFCSMFFCFHCGRPSNGFGCSIANKHSNVCVECAFSPKTATHESHHGGLGQHILFQTWWDYKSSKPATCCWSALLDNSSLFAYCCVSCEFRIHIGCAQLPKKVTHPDFDKHPLELVFTNDEKSFKKLQDCFCEFCEEDIDPRYWFYCCAKCDQSFHVKCIPSVGLLSNVKFGGRLNIPIHTRHPVILTRMLMEGNQRCDHCREIINGFVDDMAFRCDECDFWIHFKCARDCSTTGQRGLDSDLHLWDDVISKGNFFDDEDEENEVEDEENDGDEER